MCYIGYDHRIKDIKQAWRHGNREQLEQFQDKIVDYWQGSNQVEEDKLTSDLNRLKNKTNQFKSQLEKLMDKKSKFIVIDQ